jgi:hypothetical protein
VPPASHHRVGDNAAVEQSSENEDTKKPQLPEFTLTFASIGI